MRERCSRVSGQVSAGPGPGLQKMERPFFILAAAVACWAPCATAEPTPAFPRQMSYKCTMRVSLDSHDLFAGLSRGFLAQLMGT